MPFFPAICVEVGAAAVFDGAMAAGDDIADEDPVPDAAELSFW
ncbi:MAG: hypothetical protein WB777_12640 [Mycobacterium sp.]